MALVSGIPPSAWAEEGDRAIATAVELLDEQRKANGRQPSRKDGRQLSG